MGQFSHNLFSVNDIYIYDLNKLSNRRKQEREKTWNIDNMKQSDVSYSSNDDAKLCELNRNRRAKIIKEFVI
jgi:hypothetical protein